jgi:hypothetical protein
MGVLSSKELLLWLLGAWVLYYVTSAFLLNEAFATFVQGLRSSFLIRIPYILLIVSGFLNIVRVVTQRWQKGRAYALLSMVLPFGAVVFLTGFFLSAGYRQAMWVQVGEGQMVSPPWAGLTLQVEQIKPALNTETLQSEMDSDIFAFEPEVVLFDGTREHVVGAFPPTQIGDTYYHILNFGLAPGVRLKKGGRVLEEGYVMLGILPPGAQDSFDIRPLPYNFSVRIAPEKVLQKGDARMKLYNLDRLTYEVEVRRGDKTLFEGSTSDERVVFEGTELSFMEPTYWVLLDVVKDPGRPVLLWGLAIAMVGLPTWLLVLFIGKRKAG